MPRHVYNKSLVKNLSTRMLKLNATCEQLSGVSGVSVGTILRARKGNLIQQVLAGCIEVALDVGKSHFKYNKRGRKKA